MTRLRVCDLSVGVGTEAGERRLVREVDFAVGAGELLGIVGETGAGKTLTSRAVLGLLAKNLRAEGLIDVDGETFAPGSDEARTRLGSDLAVVLQNPMGALNPLARVGTQLAEGVRHLGLLDREAAEARARELLAQLGFPDVDRVMGLYPHQLSGGMAQRVTIAGALMSRPKVLIVDEPTSALDATVRVTVLELLRELAREHGAAVVLVSHDLALVGRFCDRLVVMRDGAVVESGRTCEVFRAPADDYTRMLLAAGLTVDAAPRTFLPVGATVVEPAPRPPVDPDAAPAALALDVSRTYAGAARAALHPVSVTVERGRTVAIVGESGAGKSTLARILAGLEQPSTGSVRVGDRAPEYRPGKPSPVQMVFQHPAAALNPLISVGDSIAEPIRKLPKRERRARVAEAMQAVGLDPARGVQRPSSFSGGQLQRIVVARALVADPEVLICDEPTSALDVSVQAQIINLLLRLQAEHGFGCVLVTHDLGVVRVLADEIVVLRDGAVVERGSADAFFDGPVEPYSRELLEAGSLVPGLALSDGAAEADVGERSLS